MMFRVNVKEWAASRGIGYLTARRRVVTEVGAVRTAQGRRLLVVDPAEVDDDLVRDVTEVLTSWCARLYGRRWAANRAGRAIDAATTGGPG